MLTRVLVGSLCLLVLAAIVPATRVLTRAIQDTRESIEASPRAQVATGEGTPISPSAEPTGIPEPAEPTGPVESAEPTGAAQLAELAELAALAELAVKPTSSPSPDPKLIADRLRLVRFPSRNQLDVRYEEEQLFRVTRQDRQALDFRAASYNLLGASHTVGPRGRRGYAPASARLPQQVALLEHHGVSVAGLQEFQHPQTNHLARLRGKTYQSFPGLRLGDRLSQNSIIWRTDTWELIESRTTPIPYFGGRPVAMPHVLLRHRSSGRQVWFGNYHNPANIGGDHARWRREAIRIEAALARRLGADGTPVIMTGDMNDRAGFACPFSAQSGMHSSDGARTSQGGCQTPRQMSVNWIFGTTEVKFSDYAADWSSHRRRLSDHPLIATTVSLLPPSENPRCVRARSFTGFLDYCPRP